MIHILESSEDALVAYLKELRSMTQQGEPKVLEARVLLMSHDIPERLFEAWSFRSIVASSREQLDSSLSQKKAATGCLSQLLGLAVHLRKTPKANLKNAMDLLSERVPELLPSEDLLTLLLQHETYLSVEDFLSLYYSELSFVEDSELVWPLPSHVFPYNN
ncbi:testis-expressed protein 47-like [Pollicipes pollicipes]|uniref:testis-expressed protein 47-like n=1 Tax=Pollicipes pollicipes TaxID=41117 RepID=UPI0018857BB3|nr:testis-expressed protein 47-like [Pollicipes pollicipes]